MATTTTTITFLLLVLALFLGLSHCHRPEYVLERLAKNQDLYYFGLGSNMLRSKLENRSSNGTIRVKSFKPAVVKNHRLAFNMRGFLPLEPGMGSLEPIDSNHKPLYPYERPETHGALIKLDSKNYEKVMNSEGVSMNNTQAGYEEIVVDAYPYGSKKPVKCVALRARDHVRLSKDPCPSPRYMRILREGAVELGLESSYQKYLEQHPVQQVPKWVRYIAINNLLFLFTFSRIAKTRILSRIQSFLLFRTYVPSNGPRILQFLHHLFTAMITLPGAMMGLLMLGFFKVTKKEPPAFWSRMRELWKAEDEVERQQQQQQQQQQTSSRSRSYLNRP
jgi:hypothetical protein